MQTPRATLDLSVLIGIVLIGIVLVGILIGCAEGTDDVDAGFAGGWPNLPFGSSGDPDDLPPADPSKALCQAACPGAAGVVCAGAQASGKTDRGRLLGVVEAPAVRHGSSVGPAGDVDGDGHNDFLWGSGFSMTNTHWKWDYASLGSSPGGTVRLYSGAPGLGGLDAEARVLADIERPFPAYGAALSTVGDVDGDGKDDFGVGAPGWSNKRGAVQILTYKGGAASVLQNIKGVEDNEYFGWAVVSLGNMDGEGGDDFAVASPGKSKVTIYTSSGTPQPTFTVWATASQPGWGGWSLANVGDLDQDGVDDLAIGAPWLWYNGWKHTGAVKLYSTGKAQDIGWLELPPAWRRMAGWDVAGVGDVNGDGFSEIAVTAVGHSGWRGGVWLFSGQTRKVLSSFVGWGSWQRLGETVAATGDVNGDGIPDLAVGSMRYWGNRGLAFVLSGADMSVIGDVWTWPGDGSTDYFMSQGLSGLGARPGEGGDLNGDGLADVLAAGWVRPGGTWLFGLVGWFHDAGCELASVCGGHGLCADENTCICPEGFGGACCDCAVACDGRGCGDDGCGGSCGACAATEVCSEDGQCVCEPSCVGRECGDDGCDGSCGDCAGVVCGDNGTCLYPGDTCADPLVVNAVPTTLALDAAQSHDAMFVSPGACTLGTPAVSNAAMIGDGLGDRVIAFTAPAANTYEVRLEYHPDTVWADNAGLYLVDTCEAPDPTCRLFMDWSAPVVTFDLGAGETIYAVADTAATAGPSAYSLIIACHPRCDGAVCGDDQCGGSCGQCGVDGVCIEGECFAAAAGDTCEEAVVIGALPFQSNGQTKSATHDYLVGSGACPTTDGVLSNKAGAAAGDVVFTWASTPYEQKLRFTVSPATDFDAALYVLDAECSGCLATRDAGAVGGVELLEMVVPALTAINVVVDGSTQGQAGAFGFSVSCVPHCLDQVCGDDGCGGSCGTCDDAIACTTDTCDGGVCSSTLEASFCRIAGQCVSEGDKPTGEECKACVPAQSTTDYTALGPETACGAGGVFSCVDGACCDPTALCDNKQCNDNGCGGECPPCEGCTIDPGHCLIDGACVVTAASHPTDECKWCLPSLGQHTWQPKVVGTACGTDQVCNELGGCEDPGQACETAIVVDSLPFTHSGAFGSGGWLGTGTVNLNAFPCASFAKSSSQVSEMFYRYVATEHMHLQVEVAVSTALTIAVFRDCLSDCLKANTYSGYFAIEVNAGDEVVVALEPYFASAKDATYDVGFKCAPQCWGKSCGDDGCGGQCGGPCADGELCYGGQCCMPDCSDGYECGPGSDGCGGACGCATGAVCDPNGECCEPQCAYNDCGDNSDGCGGECACDAGEVCHNGSCCEPSCTDPPYVGMECGPNSDYCGGQCDCAADQVCSYGGEQSDSTCCIPTCDGSCGDDSDGCGGECTCGADEICFAGSCCTPTCDGTECGGATAYDLDGDDGCGGTCECAQGDVCLNDSWCCTPTCDGLFCGPNTDNCGGGCGCDEDHVCTASTSWQKLCIGEGDSCVEPTVIDSLDYDDTNVLKGRFIDVGCNQSKAGKVYSLTIPEDGKYAIAVDSDAVHVMVDTVCERDVITTCGYKEGKYTCGLPIPHPECTEPTSGVPVVLKASDNPHFFKLWAYQKGLEYTFSVECVKQCDSKECGSDGCGGVCGTCAPNDTCLPSGTCCQTTCTAESECDDNDGCGSTCGCINDDGLACTTPVCSSSECVFEVSSGCLIDGVCQPPGPAAGFPCRSCDPVQWKTGWINTVDGTPCGQDLVCSSGTCADKATVCPDGECCLPDVNCAGRQCGVDNCGGFCPACPPGLGCTVDAGHCRIESKCWTEGDSNPANPCQACITDGWGQHHWTPTVGEACGDGFRCTASADCIVEGSDLDTAIPVTSLPFSHSDVASGIYEESQLWACSTGYDTRERVFFYAPAIAHTLTVSLSGDAAFSYYLIDQYEDCIVGTPVADTSTQLYEMTVGEPVYIVVEGPADWANGAFSLTLGCSCSGRNCGHDGCGNYCDGGETGFDGAAPSSPCNDARVCTADACVAAQCVNTTIDGWCLIDGACMTPGTPKPDNLCRLCNPDNSKSEWSNSSNSLACGSDGSHCLWGACCTPKCNQSSSGFQCGLTDSCGGICGCDDDRSCTVDSCTSNYKCDFALQAGFCLIGGSCVNAGEEEPDNPCRICDPATSATAWSPVADGTVCGAGLVCFEAACCDGQANCAAAGVECLGDDGCGGDCGECGAGTVCYEDVCCAPQCDGYGCGDNGCGDVCGTCTDDDVCVNKNCCTPSCQPDSCGGGDGCGGVCGAPGDVFECALEGNPGPVGNTFWVFTEVSLVNANDDYDIPYVGDVSGAACMHDSLPQGIDVVLTYQVPTASLVRVETWGVGPSTSVSVHKGADLEACAEEQSVSGYYGGYFYLEGGVTYYAVVKADSEYSAPDTVTVAFRYVDLCQGRSCGTSATGLDCGTCPADAECEPDTTGRCLGTNNTCEDALELELGKTSTQDDNPSSYPYYVAHLENPHLEQDIDCLYDEDPDDVYTVSVQALEWFKFTAPANARLVKIGGDASYSVYRECGQDCPIEEWGNLPVVGGEDYFLALRGYAGYSNDEPDKTINVVCVADCYDRMCGDDGCGASCGTCPLAGDICNPAGTCDCTPSCEHPTTPGVVRTCGHNDCGETCGSCPLELVQYSCEDFACTCTPQCTSSKGLPHLCGDDLCSGYCDGIAVCDDAIACTTDACSLVSATIDSTTGERRDCTYTLQAGFCRIDDECITAGTLNPDSPCAVCDPSKSTSAWTELAQGTSCGEGLVCFHDPADPESFPACCEKAVNCEGRTCGDDACGGTCGSCTEGAACTDDPETDLTGDYCCQYYPSSSSSASSGYGCQYFNDLDWGGLHDTPDCDPEPCMYGVCQKSANPAGECLSEPLPASFCSSWYWFPWTPGDKWCDGSSGAICIEECPGAGQCGSNGCNSTCGTCASGQLCTGNRECASPTTCAAAATLTALPAVADLADGGSAAHKNACTVEEDTCGVDVAHNKHFFTVPSLDSVRPGLHRVTLTRGAGTAGVMGLYGVARCGCSRATPISDYKPQWWPDFGLTLLEGWFGDGCPGGCLAQACMAADEAEVTLEVTVPPGDTYRAIVAGVDTYQITAVCIPDCEGRECGPNGCGGQCGPACNAAAGQVCKPNGVCCDTSDCSEACAGYCSFGVCGPDETCCVPSCTTPDGKFTECGIGFCGMDCGTADDGNECTVDTCVDGLISNQPFTDLSYGVCGTSGVCQSGTCCETGCVECGQGECGIICGTCVGDQVCTESVCRLQHNLPGTDPLDGAPNLTVEDLLAKSGALVWEHVRNVNGYTNDAPGSRWTTGCQYDPAYGAPANAPDAFYNFMVPASAIRNTHVEVWVLNGWLSRVKGWAGTPTPPGDANWACPEVEAGFHTVTASIPPGGILGLIHEDPVPTLVDETIFRITCLPDCEGRVCGSDGCGGECGPNDCDDGEPGTDDYCDGEGACQNPVHEGTCLIDAVSYDVGTVDPANDCNTCTEASQTAWTYLGDLQPCGDTPGDVCHDDVCCTPFCVDNPLACGDNGCGVSCGFCEAPVVDCQTNNCTAGVCVTELLAGNCLIDGACHEAGAVHPTHACRVCDTSLSTTEWSVLDGHCFADGVCREEGQLEPGDVCQTCRPDVTRVAWSPVCDSPNVCLSDGTCCTPQCLGKACGPDQCGGTCGAGCSGSANGCYDGQCHIPGDNCAAAKVLNLGGDNLANKWKHSFSTDFYNATSAGPEDCFPNDPSFYRRKVHRFVPGYDFAGTLKVTASAQVSVSVLDGGCDLPARGCKYQADGADIEMDIEVPAGIEYVIVISGPWSGTYTLELEGTCDPPWGPSHGTCINPCDDGKWCTADKQQYHDDGFGSPSHTCQHPLLPASYGGCLIGGGCYEDGDLGAALTTEAGPVVCRQCNPSLTRTGWSPRFEGLSESGCPSDLVCGRERCKAPGHTCAKPAPLAVAQPFTGVFDRHSETWFHSNACSNGQTSGQGYGEVVTYFESGPTASRWRFDASQPPSLAAEYGKTPDIALMAVQTTTPTGAGHAVCAGMPEFNSSCIGFVNGGGPGAAESLIIDLPADTTVAIIAEERANSMVSDGQPAGGVTITAACAPNCDGRQCGPGGCGVTCNDSPNCQELGGHYSCTESGQCQCNPFCDGRVCGTDLCGGQCGSLTGDEGCPDDGTACVGGLCRPVGETCDNPLTIAELPFTADGQSMSAWLDTDADLASACGSGGPGVVGLPEIVWSYTPPNDQVLEITMGASGGAATGYELLASNSCGSQADCTKHTGSGTGNKHTVSVQGGAPTFFSVNAAAGVTVDFAVACVPQCEGKQCGPDGCGGTCGTCPQGATCHVGKGLCTGNHCADPFVLPYPASVEGTTVGGGNGSQRTDQCIGLGSATGADSPEQFYRVAFPETREYRVTVSPEAGFDAMVYVLRSCSGQTGDCRMAASKGAGVDEVLTFTAEKNVPYVVVVDGAGGSGSAGTFQLTIDCSPQCLDKNCGDDTCGGSCGGCDPGQMCVDNTCCGTLCDATYCGFDAGCGANCSCDDGIACTEDVCTSTQCSHDVDPGWCLIDGQCVTSGTYSPTSGCQVCTPSISKTTWSPAAGSGMCAAGFVCYEDACCDKASTCAGKSCGSDGCGGTCGTCTGPNDLCTDGVCVCQTICPQGAQCGDDGCGGTCGTGICPPATSCDQYEFQCFESGETCGTAVKASVNFTTGLHNGNTTGAGDQHGVDHACGLWDPAAGFGSPDKAHYFEVPSYYDHCTVVVTTTGEWDAVAYVIGDCADDAGSCIAATDEPQPLTMSFPVTGGSTYTVIVDGAVNSWLPDFGAYWLEVNCK